MKIKIVYIGVKDSEVDYLKAYLYCHKSLKMNLSFNQLSISTLGAMALTLGFAASSHALSFTTFTDINAFQNATSGLSLETFNAEAISTNKNHDLTDFDINSNMTWTRIDDGTGTANIDGSNFLRLQSRNHTTSATLNFDTQINAFGFDWANTDTGEDTLELIVGDQTYVFGAAQQSGFFGILADGLFADVQFSDTEGGGYLQYGGIDNILYGNSPQNNDAQNVPTPAAVLPSLVGMFAGSLRKKRNIDC